MTLRGLAKRYAQALFDVLPDEPARVASARALDELRELVAGHDELRRALDTPVVPSRKKRAILEAIFAQAPEVPDPVRRLLLLLADDDRLTLLPALADAFRERVMTSQHVVAGEVVTAVPLPESSRTAMADALGRAAGATVRLTASVDPSIVGGVVARVGSRVFDGSVTRQLDRLRQALVAER